MSSLSAERPPALAAPHNGAPCMPAIAETSETEIIPPPFYAYPPHRGARKKNNRPPPGPALPYCNPNGSRAGIRRDGPDPV